MRGGVAGKVIQMNGGSPVTSFGGDIWVNKNFKIPAAGVDLKRGDTIRLAWVREPDHVTDTCNDHLRVVGIEIRYEVP